MFQQQSIKRLLWVLSLIAAMLFGGPASAQEKTDPQIAGLAGIWTVTYTNDAVRVYNIEKDGKVAFTESQLPGKVERKGTMLLLTFEGDGKLERLTLGTDGRLFVEHYHPKDDFPDKRPTHVGIGVRQKDTGEIKGSTEVKKTTNGAKVGYEIGVVGKWKSRAFMLSFDGKGVAAMVKDGITDLYNYKVDSSGIVTITEITNEKNAITFRIQSLDKNTMRLELKGKTISLEREK